MTGADAVVSALKKLCVEHVFGIVSIHNMPIFDAINRDGSIKIIDTRHEMGATHAADGYARATGKIGVVIASTGPGTTNTITGLYEASYASSPVLLITGQAETAFYGKHQGYVHEAENQLQMLRTVTRRAESPRFASQIEEFILQVASDMFSGRPQPGAVEIPIDLQYDNTQTGTHQFAPASLNPPDSSLVTQAAELIGMHKKRIIIAGGGVTRGKASQALIQFAEILNAPVFTTANGRGVIPEDHPLCIGNLYQSRRLHDDLKDCELSIAIGTRFQVGVNGSGANLKPPGKLLHLDIDPASLNLTYAADLAIEGDARQLLEAILLQLNAEPGNDPFLQKIQQSAKGVKLGLRKRIGPDYEGIMESIRANLPRDGNIVRDSTVPAYNFANQLLEIYEPGTFIGPNSGAIGPGLPLAIGMAIGTGKKTVVIHGDGGFMLHATELATAAQYSVPLVVCVFNDGGYGVLRGLQKRQFDGNMFEVDLGFVDFKMFAESMGVTGFNVQSLEEFKSAFAKAMDEDGPCLLNIDMRELEPMQGSILPEG
ncbi:MAG: thiamine pyrophosphate-binding protein [Proteobacteria bacterium]|nr:thiamine pyrophosphate-binding protein [Pseudomonadota bacterium]